MVVNKLQLTEIDRHFGNFICRLAGGIDDELFRAAALASCSVGNGHVCFDLRNDWGQITAEGLERLTERLRKFPVIGMPGEFTPLILDDAGRLYLHRYWQYEQELAAKILEIAGSPAGEIDEELLHDGLMRLFPNQRADEVDWQQVAAIVAVTRRFCVISGGPGTGKTSTVGKILALLVEQRKGRALRIALAAPTGKAAARLSQSLLTSRESLNCAAETKELIPSEVSTLHRLIGMSKSGGRFRYDRDNPLPYDVIVIDEASMVSLTLMSRLVQVLGRETRLILLGDRDQLASVEAGAVLGDICADGTENHFSQELCDTIARLTGKVLGRGDHLTVKSLADSLVILRKNYRFNELRGIGRICREVNAGAGQGVLAVVKSDSQDLRWQYLPQSAQLEAALTASVLDGYRSYLQATSPGEALDRFDYFRVLCALRQGPYGVERLNVLIGKVLSDHRLIESGKLWYRGRPIMVTRNDYGQRLFNGDIGIVYPDREVGGELRVFFRSSDGGIRSLSPHRLPPHETVYAMTVHKSQGSEFSKVLLLLPDVDTELLTRELVYTAVSRAREHVEIWGEEELFSGIVVRNIERRGGLREALWKVSGNE